MHNKYKDIVIFKTVAELKAEAARSYLGIMWWILEPLLYMAVFYIVFAVVLKRGRGEDYVLFLLIGLVVWKWFSSSIGYGANSIAINAGLMRQVYLPKYIFVHISVFVNTFKFSIVFFLLLLFVLLFGNGISHVWFSLPIVVLVQFSAIIFLSTLAAAILPVFPDLKMLIDNGLTLMFFLSGIFFSIENIPQHLQAYFNLNPMAVLISSYRNIMLYQSWPDWQALLIILSYSVLGYYFSRRLIGKLDKVYPKIILR